LDGKRLERFQELTGRVLRNKLNEEGACRECGKPGKQREDKGLAAGIHCDECWEKLVTECRKRSW